MASSIVKFFDAHSRPPRGGYLVTIEGLDFSGNDESQVQQQVSQWRRNNGTFTSEEDISAELWRYWCNRDPERCRVSGGKPDGTVEPKPRPVEARPEVIRRGRYASSMDTEGPRLWAQLHVEALGAELDPPGYRTAKFSYFVSRWAASIHCDKCRSTFSLILARMPIPASQFFEWSVAVHNAVNAEPGLNKPQVSLEEARNIWSHPS